MSDSLRRSWCLVDTAALADNIRALRALIGSQTTLAPVVKSNAYGHGLHIAARAFLGAGADWLCVDSLHEAVALRDGGIDAPIWILGWVPPQHADPLVATRARAIVYDPAQVDAFAAAARRAKREIELHVKLETGTHRQGLELDDATRLAQRVHDADGASLGGISSHFANVEDTTDHTYARTQLRAFEDALEHMRNQGLNPRSNSIANSAATIVLESSLADVVRPGVAAYGMWPSRETFLSAHLVGRQRTRLEPALTWCTRVAQLKTVPPGKHVGYGCTYRTSHVTRLAVLPVGYYDGYDRGVSNLAHVLVRGERAPLRGRVCMNMMMVDVTDIEGVSVGDEAVLLGAQGDETISAERFAEWAATINYEVTTRILEAIPRRPR